jgi:hypothetical protein
MPGEPQTEHVGCCVLQWDVGWGQKRVLRAKPTSYQRVWLPPPRVPAAPASEPLMASVSVT